LFAILTMRPSPGAVREGALLLELDGAVVEEVSPIDPLEGAAFISGARPQEFAARDLVRAIDAAAKDDRIKAIALDLAKFTGGGLVHMEEIGDALDRFRQSKKKVLAYASAYTDDSVLLAAHADEVWVDPMGGAAITGPAASGCITPRAREVRDQGATCFRVGTYKSAVEPYLLSAMSPERRARTTSSSTARCGRNGRPTSAGRGRRRTSSGRPASSPTGSPPRTATSAQAALAAGLADRIGTRDEWGERLAKIAGVDEVGRDAGRLRIPPSSSPGWPRPRPTRLAAGSA
jgi:protease-4